MVEGASLNDAGQVLTLPLYKARKSVENVLFYKSELDIFETSGV